MNRHILSSWARRLGIIRFTDTMRFYAGLIKTYPKRRKFFMQNKGVKLPPPYYIYETFNLNYFGFYNDSIKTAGWLAQWFQSYSLPEETKILDWGCGPGRIIRHLPGMLPQSFSFYGTDYNKKYIDWCQRNIPEVTFKNNGIAPPLGFENNFFDVVYGISIFTHLSEQRHKEWFDELIRVTKPGGLLFLSFHGQAFRVKLTETERKIFDEGEIVIKGKTKEGHRTYGAFHPEPYVRKLSSPHQVIEHKPGTISNGRPQQDWWVIRKV